MGKASSAKKVARLAQKGKGRKVRFQGGTLFPAVMVIVSLIGAGLIIYSRASIPDRNVPPTIEDHWHASYGFYACDKWLPDLQGAKEEVDSTGAPISDEYRRTGIHSHNDGVMHWHPFTSAASGRNAKLGVFLDVYGVKITDSKLEFPKDQGGAKFEEGVTQCKDADGKMVDAQLTVYVFKSFDTPGDYATYITNFRDIRLTQDGMAFAIVFAAPGTRPGLPPSASDLPRLGAADTGSTGQSSTTSTPGASTPVDSTPGGSTSSTVAPSSAAPTTTLG